MSVKSAWVTGATGFLGSALVDRLLDRGDVVTVQVRPRSLRRAERWADRVRRVITDLPAAPGAFRDAPRPDVVFHCAGDLFPDGPDYAARAHRLHVGGTAQIADLCLAAQAKLVHVSSLSVYGFVHHARPVDEDTPFAPNDSYGETKVLGERALIERGRRGLDYAILRPPSIYGPGSRGDLVLWMARSIARRRFFLVDDDDARLSLCFLDHCVDALLLLADLAPAPTPAHRAFVVDDGRPVSRRALATEIARALGRWPVFPRMSRGTALAAALVVEHVFRTLRRPSPPWSTGRVARRTLSFAYDISRIRALGYRPRIDLPEAIARTVAGHRAAGTLFPPAPSG